MNMRHDKRMLTVPVLLMIALSILGAAYAHWTDMIKMNGIVNTGTLNIAYLHAYCIEKEEWLGLPKDVGKCEVWLSNLVRDVHTNKTGYKKLWINITNAYPTYWCNVTFVLWNIGTVPGVFKNFTIIPKTPGLVFQSIGPDKWEAKDTTLPGDPAIFNMELVNLVRVQLDPCHKTKGQLDFHFKQSAPECHTYEFAIRIDIQNWDP